MASPLLRQIVRSSARRANSQLTGEAGTLESGSETTTEALETAGCSPGSLSEGTELAAKRPRFSTPSATVSRHLDVPVPSAPIPGLGIPMIMPAQLNP